MDEDRSDNTVFGTILQAVSGYGAQPRTEKESYEGVLKDSADAMYKYAYDNRTAEPKDGDKERLEDLFRKMISMLPPGIDKEEFMKGLVANMPEFLAEQKKKDK